MGDGRRYDIPTLLGLDNVGGVLGATLALVCLIFVWIMLSCRTAHRGRYLQGAFAVAIVANATLFFLYLDVFGTLRTDEPVWHLAGVEARQLLLGERVGGLSTRDDKQGYAWLAGLVYVLFGELPLVLIILNGIFHLLAIGSLARCLDNFGGALNLPREATRRAAGIGAWVLALAPGVLLWSPQVMRETVSLLLVCLGLEGLTLIMNGRLVKGSVAALLACWMLYEIRGGVGIGLLTALLVSMVLAMKVKGRLAREKRVALFVLSGVLAGATMFASGITDRLSGASVAQEMQYLSRTAESGFGADYGESPWLTVLTTNVPRVLFGPFPWGWGAQFGVLLALADAFVWIPVVFLAGRLALRCDGEQRRLTIAVLGFAAVMVAVLAVGVSNYGMLSRLRPIALPPLIILAAFSLVIPRSRRSDQELPVGLDAD